MTKDEKIKELELEVARLNGVIEGMSRAKPVNPYIVPYYTNPNPFWYQTYCDNRTYGVTTPATVPYSSGTSTTADFGPTTISGMN